MNNSFAVCNVSVAPLRAEPKHASEQTSQLLFGEKVTILSDNQKGWLFISCEWDEYTGWIKKSQLHFLSKKEYLKRLHFFSAEISDKIILQQNHCCLISPGSSLYQLKGTKLNWLNNTDDCNTTYKGKKINLSKIEQNAESLIENAHKFLGTPYQWGGRSIMGIDCSGLSQMAYKLINFRLPRDAKDQALQGTAVAFLQDAVAGDLAFFDNEDGKINHVGILLNNNQILHSTDTSGCVVIDKIDSEGIISLRRQKRTHRLRVIKRYLKKSAYLLYS